MRAAWIVLFGGCTQPAPATEVGGGEQLVAAAEQIDAAAARLETAAASLEQSVKAMEAWRGVEAEAKRLATEARDLRPRPAPIPEPDGDASTTEHAIPGAADAVACPSEGKCTVKRTFVDTLAGDVTVLARQLRVVPSQKDGEVEGLKLFGIRRGSLPALLGFKNGDLVVRVAGKDLASVEDAMAVYVRLRDADQLSVEFIRRGTPLLLEIAIVD